MSRCTRSHLADHVLLRDLGTLAARDRALTAELPAHLAETDARRLYLPAAYPSMFACCWGELGFSEDRAYRRIRAARVAREHPEIFDAIAAGRLNLTTAVMLAPQVTSENVGELLTPAAGRTKAVLEQLLAERYPQPNVATSLRSPAAPAGAARARRPCGRGRAGARPRVECAGHAARAAQAGEGRGPRGDRLRRARFPRRCGARCGGATAAAARS